MFVKAFLAGGCLLAFSAGLAWSADQLPASLLVEPAELAQPEFAKGFRILDARIWRHYAQRHLCDAVWVDFEAWDEAFRDGKDVSFWEQQIGALGINVNTHVIIYDNGSNVNAATIRWILRYWGVEDVRLLHTGWPGWLFAQQRSSRALSQVEARSIKLQPQYHRRAVKQQVLEIVQSRSEQLIDVRSYGEFRGIESTARRKGAIPSARHLDGSDGLDPYQHMWRFKSVEGLSQMFHEAGIDPTLPTTIYGRSGGTAPLLAFTLELVGAKNVRIYSRGWEEWGNAKDTPVALPPKAISSTVP
jgi:thiosulfate/3-mercaptopyruvate sulfurtransferase